MATTYAAAEAADPWAISEASFPRDGTLEDQLRFLVGYAVLAPSNHNNQPWLFAVDGDRIELYADRARALPVIDPDDRELVMSCGAALYHLRVALAYFGFGAEVERLPLGPSHDRLAVVRVRGPSSISAAELVHMRVALGQERAGGEGDGRIEGAVELVHGRLTHHAEGETAALFRAIPRRRTNRGPFERRPVDPTVLAGLVRAAAAEDAWLDVVEGLQNRDAIAYLVGEADRVQWANRSFRREIAAWLHPNRSHSRDGIPGYGLGLSDLESYAGPLVVRTFDLGQGRAAHDRDIAVASPALAVLGTDADTPAAWLAAGQALGRVLLRARADGVWASFLNQPIEVPELRDRVAGLLERLGSHPQLVLRLGYGQDVRPTPRRPVHDVLL